MELLFLLLEPFLPELASKLGGKNAAPLCKRLFHSGLSMLFIAMLFLLLAFFEHIIIDGLPLNKFDFFDIKIYMAWLFGGLGLGLLLSAVYYQSKTQDNSNG